MAEHRPNMKNNQSEYYLSFSFTPKTGIELSKQLFHFYSETNPCFCSEDKTRDERNLVIFQDWLFVTRVSASVSSRQIKLFPLQVTISTS